VQGETPLLDPEQELVEAARNGSGDAFAQLVARYRAKVFSIAYRITHHYHDAEDIIQTTFLRAFIKLSQFRGNSRFSTWLGSIAANEALMRMRRRRLSEVLINESKEFGEGRVVDYASHMSEANPEKQCSCNELRCILATAVDKLKPQYRLVFKLRYLEGLSTQEIAQSLNLSLPAVKSRLARSRRTLRASLVGFAPRESGVMTQPGTATSKFRPRSAAPIEVRFLDKRAAVCLPNNLVS
jgi:RNA polymerase sigma-70 factor (ECF subfamily)